MGLFDRPTRNGFDRMFDFNRDDVLDPSEMDAQECFLHSVDMYDEIDAEDYDDFDDDEFEEDEGWEDDF